MSLSAVWALIASAGVSVDVAASRHPISPGIYGANSVSDAQAARMGVTLKRFGGNTLSRYNFQARTTNEGGDGFWFRNRVMDGGVDAFVASARATASQPVVELPLLGWVSKAGSATAPPWTCGFSVSKYGAQTSVAPDDSNCGNGIWPDGGVVRSDPNDTSVAIDAGHLRAYVTHLVDAGVSFFVLGNQPGLWHQTHADVHPQRATYAEIRDRLAESSALVKSINPVALTLGPAEWGWINYFDSAAGDRAAAGIDFVPYYLREARFLEISTGVRPLDYLDLHVYPQAANPDALRILSNDSSNATAALRLRSTRILWDPSYTVESWENCCFDTVLRIIPRMRSWVASNYPGTGLAIGAYTWGAPDHISGALAQADVLGVFAREGIELAILEVAPPDGALLEDAFKLYRDYDGAGARFGSTSVGASSDDPSVSAFAASEGTLVFVVLLNKSQVQNQLVDVTLAGVPGAGAFRAFRFSQTQRLSAAGSGTFTGGALSRLLPPWTAELLELAPAAWDGGVTVPDGGPDGGPTDAGASDAGAPDAGAPDAGQDGGAGDGGGPDSGAPDAGRPDSGAADAGPKVDGGNGGDGGDGGGNGVCRCGSVPTPLALLVLMLAWRWRRRSTAGKFTTAAQPM